MGEALFQVKATLQLVSRLFNLAPMCFVKSHARSASLAKKTTSGIIALPHIQRGPSVNDGSFPQRSTSAEVANVVFSLPTKSIGLFP
jgi:hypothetical protein